MYHKRDGITNHDGIEKQSVAAYLRGTRPIKKVTEVTFVVC